MTFLLVFCYMLGSTMHIQGGSLIDIIQLNVAFQEINQKKTKLTLSLPKDFDRQQALKDIDAWIALFDKKLNDTLSQASWAQDKALPSWITDAGKSNQAALNNLDEFIGLYFSAINIFPTQITPMPWIVDIQMEKFLRRAVSKLKKLFEKVRKMP